MNESNPPSFGGGPFLAAAFLCETVLQEESGAISAIRIVHEFVAKKPPPESPNVRLQVTMLVKIHPGQRSDSGQLIIYIYAPDGRALLEAKIDLDFQGDDMHRGLSGIAPILLPIVGEGIYWADVSIDDMLMTRIPFSIQWESGAPQQSEE